MFTDRTDAALALINALRSYQGRHGVVLAIPRGGVPIGYIVAKALGFTLDIILTKKIGHPRQPELAIGAVSLQGQLIDPRFHIPPSYVEAEVEKIRAQLVERYHQYVGGQEPTPLTGKIAILVDDGIATGSTVLVILELLRKSNPEKLIVAVPVAPRTALEKIRPHVDELVCLETPPDFYAVGQFYEDFSPVSDEEVISLLQQNKRQALG